MNLFISSRCQSYQSYNQQFACLSTYFNQLLDVLICIVSECYLCKLIILCSLSVIKFSILHLISQDTLRFQKIILEILLFIIVNLKCFLTYSQGFLFMIFYMSMCLSTHICATYYIFNLYSISILKLYIHFFIFLCNFTIIFNLIYYLLFGASRKCLTGISNTG